MENKTIKIGDVVQLKSGGPKMTVIAVDGDAVQCVWFFNEKDTNVERFPEAILEIC